MHKRSKLPSLGSGSPFAASSSPGAIGRTPIPSSSGSASSTPSTTASASPSSPLSPSSPSDIGRHHRRHHDRGEEGERQQDALRSGHTAARHGQRASSRPICTAVGMDESQHVSSKGNKFSRSSTSSSLASGALQTDNELSPGNRDLQARELQPLPSLGPRSKAAAGSSPTESGCEGSRPHSPVRSTPTPPSVTGSSRRSSSSTITSKMDAQEPICPAPPPDVAAITMPAQPARSRTLRDSRTGSRTPDPTRTRTRGGILSRDSTPSRCMTPDLGYTEAGRAHAFKPSVSTGTESASWDLHQVASANESSTLPLSRAGWSGTLESDQEHAQRAKPLPPLVVKHGKSVHSDSEPTSPVTPGTPSAPHSERRRRPRRVSGAGESTIRSSSVGKHDLPGESLEKALRRKGMDDGSISPGSHSSSAPSPESTQKNRSSSVTERVTSSLTVAGAGATESAKSASTSVSRLSAGQSSKSPMSRWNPRQRLRNGSRDDSFLSTISESTFSSDSSSTDAKAQRDSKIMVPDGSHIEVFSESQTGDGRTQVDVLKDFRLLFQQESAAHAEQMQLLLRQYGFDKPLDMQRKVMPLVMSAFRDEQKSFITVQGSPQCGKTSALVLGILGAIGAEMGGIRAVVLSTSSSGDFKKYFDICSEVHPLRLECFEGVSRKVSFAGLPPDPDSVMAGVDPLDDLQRLSSGLASGAPAMVYGHPARVLPLLREAPSWGVDLSNVQVLALDDAEETICMGLMDEVCEVCTILRHFSKHRLRQLILSHFLSTEAKSMIKCLRNSLLRQQNLFGIRAHRTQARAKAVNHYYAVAPRAKWPAMLAALHHALSLPSGIIFDDASPEARSQARLALRTQGVTASVWNALQEQGSGARAAARDSAANAPRGPAFHLMPSDLVVLKMDLPQVRCVLHFEIPRKELSVYGLRLMCLEQQEQKKASRKGGPGGKSLSVLFVEGEEVVRELEKTFHIRMEEVPTEMLAA